MAVELKTEDINNTLTLNLDDKGRITALQANALKCDAFPVDIEVVDELTNRIFKGRDAETEKVSDTSFIHRWQDADFLVEENYKLQSDKILRSLTARLIKDAPMRSVTIRLLVSYPDNIYRVKCFTANEYFPCDSVFAGGRKVYFGDVCYGTVMPFAGYYSSEAKSALTFGMRFDKDFGGRLAFAFRDYHSEGVDVEFSMLLLSNERNAECELVYAATAGCWRSILKFWRDSHPEFFAAENPVLAQKKGPFFISNWQMDDAYIASITKKYAPLWAEVHNCFPRYGEYAPDCDEWESVIKHDYPDVACSGNVTYNRVTGHIDQLHKNNIQALLYLQSSGDCFIPYAEEEFPDSIARDSVGRISKTWKNCCLLNASPGTTYYTHLLEQFKRFFEKFSNIDGVFLDQVCYQMIDYAHADGKSAADCRPVSRLGDSYNATTAIIADILHKSNRSLWGNGPFDVIVTRHLDGIMSEGTSSIAKTYQYLTCGSKGLLVHSYAESAMDVESMFRYCLICGGSWSVSGDVARKVPEPYPAKVEELFDLYGKLADLLAGCQWVLEPEPFTLPDLYEGNLFELPENKLALTVVSKFDTMVKDAPPYKNKFKAVLRGKAAESVKRVILHTPFETVECAWERKGEELEITVSDHCVMSVIILENN